MLDIFIVGDDEKNAAVLKDICFKYLMQKNYESEIFIDSNVSDNSTAGIYMITFGELLENIAVTVKKNNSQSYITVLVRNADELMKSVRPPICPSGYLMKPYTDNAVSETLNNIYADYLRCRVDKDGEIFHFKVKAKNYSVPFGRIIFFESDRKKVIARTEIQEFEFYSTLENILQTAPKNFIKIHKSFVINTAHIVSADFGTMTVTFDDGSEAYISRAYKNDLKAVLEESEVKI